MTVTDVKLASVVSKDVELGAVLLRNVKLASSVTEESRPTSLGTSQKYSTRYEALRAGRLNVLVQFYFDMRQEGASEALVSLEAEYLLAYKVPETAEYTSHELECFANLSGILHVWPYWRELVHTAIARAGLGSVTLPVYRVTPKTLDLPDPTEPVAATK
jgi:hypothetical protein